MDKKEFADYLKGEKLRLNLNHNAFASLIGYSRDTYMSYYRGINGCPIEKQEAIKKILDAEV